MNVTRLALAATFILSPVAILAQATTTATTPAAAPTSSSITQRKENQQDRISQGVKSGQLTPGETAKLEHQEAGINKKRRECALRTTATSPRPINRSSTSSRTRSPSASTATSTTPKRPALSQFVHHSIQQVAAQVAAVDHSGSHLFRNPQKSLSSQKLASSNKTKQIELPDQFPQFDKVELEEKEKAPATPGHFLFILCPLFVG